MNDTVNTRVKEALNRTEIMALSTVGEDGSWISPVRFSYTYKLELSFMSMPDTKHVQNILRYPRVSVAIYSFPGPPGGNVGLQVKGTARLVDGEDGDGWQHFTITPSEVWLFDSRITRERQRVDLSDLAL